MPNASNITRPIMLVALGRSGTSLTQSILRNHPDMEVCGETAKLLFGVWNSADKMRGRLRRDTSPETKKEHQLRCGRTVRGAYLGMFGDSEKPHWFQKPIGIPRILEDQGAEPEQTEADIAWCWDVLKFSFPESRNITILRHPYDVVLSAAEFWNRSHADGWRSVVDMARIINHESSNINFALSHRRLVEEPRPEIRRLLKYLALEPHRGCFKAINKVYVPSRMSGSISKKKMPDHVERAFSRQERWSEIDQSTFTNADRDLVVAMWARFGATLEL